MLRNQWCYALRHSDVSAFSRSDVMCSSSRPAGHITDEVHITHEVRRSFPQGNTSCKKQPFVGRQKAAFCWLRRPDLNQRPSGYEPDELPGCSTPRYLVFLEQSYYTINLFNLQPLFLIFKKFRSTLFAEYLFKEFF